MLNMAVVISRSWVTGVIKDEELTWSDSRKRHRRSRSSSEARPSTVVAEREC